MSNRHFYDAEDILEEFQKGVDEISIRIEYPLRYFSSLPKEDLKKSDFGNLLKTISIPKFEPKLKKKVKSRGVWASWPSKPMSGKLAAIRDIHAQLCSEFSR